MDILNPVLRLVVDNIPDGVVVRNIAHYDLVVFRYRGFMVCVFSRGGFSERHDFSFCVADPGFDFGFMWGRVNYYINDYIKYQFNDGISGPPYGNRYIDILLEV